MDGRFNPMFKKPGVGWFFIKGIASVKGGCSAIPSYLYDAEDG